MEALEARAAGSVEDPSSLWPVGAGPCVRSHTPWLGHNRAADAGLPGPGWVVLDPHLRAVRHETQVSRRPPPRCLASGHEQHPAVSRSAALRARWRSLG
ncbi:Polyketide methyltransferase ustM [Trichinella spiralis]|uniref:Polyketide methyltransferase ustM n=1 Tax=Trichinella spiralis TaxID=6334 RepID=A0ABR3KGS9_TRISP